MHGVSEKTGSGELGSSGDGFWVERFRRHCSVEGTGALRCAQDDSKNKGKNKQRQGQKQIPFGDDNQEKQRQEQLATKTNTYFTINDMHNQTARAGLTLCRFTLGGKGKGETQGSLHCATDGEAVRRFGRDDVSLCVGEGPERTMGSSLSGRGRPSCWLRWFWWGLRCGRRGSRGRDRRSGSRLCR